MPTFNAEVNGHYAPKFEAATLKEAIDYANAHYRGIAGCPCEYTDRNICMAINGGWVPAWLVEWSEVDAEWAKPLAESQEARRQETQAIFDAWTKRLMETEPCSS